MKTYEIGLLQSAAYRRLVQHTQSHLDTYDITANQWAILGLAYESAPLRLTDIAKRLYIRPASASELVADLVEKKYLQRSENTDDRRVKDLSLSQKGTNFVQETEPKLSAHMQPLLAQASATEIAGYLQTLTSITAE